MMSQKNVKKFLTYSGVASLALLPGCAPVDWIKEKFGSSQSEVVMPREMPIEMDSVDLVDDGSPIVVTFNGKPFLSKKRLDAKIQEVRESNPQFQQMEMIMGKQQIELTIAKSMAAQEAINRYIEQHNFKNRRDYQEKLEEVTKNGKDIVNQYFFAMELPVTIGDKEVQEFYDNNKDVLPDFIISRGGVRAFSVVFDKGKDDEAHKFLDQAKGSKQSIEKVAQAAGIKDKCRDLKLVNPQSFELDSSVRDYVLNVKDIPGYGMCTTQEGSIYVVQVTGKEETQYRALDANMRQQLHAHLERQARGQMTEQKIIELEKQMNVQFSDAYFKTEDLNMPTLQS